MSAVPVLVYLYGPPAVGKLTVAEHLAAATGLPLFHNHVTVDALTPVFEFRSPPFVEVLHRIRLDVFATAMRAAISLISTNNPDRLRARLVGHDLSPLDPAHVRLDTSVLEPDAAARRIAARLVR